MKHLVNEKESEIYLRCKKCLSSKSMAIMELMSKPTPPTACINFLSRFALSIMSCTSVFYLKSSRHLSFLDSMRVLSLSMSELEFGSQPLT